LHLRCSLGFEQLSCSIGWQVTGLQCTDLPNMGRLHLKREIPPGAEGITQSRPALLAGSTK